MKMFKYFLQKTSIFVSPIFVLAVIYFLTDPFQVLHEYDNYYAETYIAVNRDFAATEMYLKNLEKYDYDSFIFGSSSATAIPPSIWMNYISTQNPVFSFYAPIENIVGVHSKIKFISSKGDTLKNALIIIDTGVTFSPFENAGHFLMKHYKVYANFRSSFFSKLHFHYQSFLSFLDLKFLMAVFHYNISKTFHPYMTGILDNTVFHVDLITNEEHFDGPISELRSDSVGYYSKRQALFSRKNEWPSEMNSQITSDQIELLEEIKDIFESNTTFYKIIISPLYNQIAFNRDDLRVLISIFGEENVFDFSGENKYTSKISNFYDGTHFKTYIGQELLNIVYK